MELSNHFEHEFIEDLGLREGRVDQLIRSGQVSALCTYSLRARWTCRRDVVLPVQVSDLVNSRLNWVFAQALQDHCPSKPHGDYADSKQLR